MAHCPGRDAPNGLCHLLSPSHRHSGLGSRFAAERGRIVTSDVEFVVPRGLRLRETSQGAGTFVGQWTSPVRREISPGDGSARRGGGSAPTGSGSAHWGWRLPFDGRRRLPFDGRLPLLWAAASLSKSSGSLSMGRDFPFEGQRLPSPSLERALGGHRQSSLGGSRMHEELARTSVRRAATKARAPVPHAHSYARLLRKVVQRTQAIGLIPEWESAPRPVRP
jgi:hypothetical protein